MAIITDMTNEQYHADPSISKSGLDLMARSPAHYYYKPFRESTRAMEIGTALHAAILEPERYASSYVILKDVKDRRDAIYKQACAAVGAERVLIEKEADKVSGMQAAINSNPSAMKVLKSGGKAEMSIFTTDPVTGVKVRARLDFITDDLQVIDVKKTQDLRVFSKTIHNYRYHVQAAFYSDVYEWETGKKLKSFKFLAVEEEFPHANRIFIPDEEMMEVGRVIYRENLNTYAECLKSNNWPGIILDDEVASLPFWALNNTDDDVEIIIGDDNE